MIARTLPIGLALLVLSAPLARSVETPSDASDDLTARVGFDQKIGAQAPLDVRLKEDSGRAVRFGEVLSGRPIVLAFGYFECPMVCNEVINAITRTARALNGTVGKDYDVVFVSISPLEGPERARLAKARVVRRYDRPGTDAGWHFLTGEDPEIHRLASALGLRYTYDEKTRQYTHPAGVIVLTPDGRASRYIFGIDFPPRNVRLALTESSGGKLGTVVDQLVLYCYRYDSATGRYTLAVMNLVRILGTLTAVTLAGSIVVMILRDRRRQSAPAGVGNP